MDDFPGQNSNHGPGASGAQAAPRTVRVSDGLGVPIAGYPDWRAGVFGAGQGLLGLQQIYGPASPSPGQGHPQPPSSGATDAPPPRFYFDAHGAVQETPDFARTHPKGPLDVGAMAHDVNWDDVLRDLASIVGGAVGGDGWGEAAALGAAGAGALPKVPPLLAKLGALEVTTLNDLNKQAQPPPKPNPQ